MTRSTQFGTTLVAVTLAVALAGCAGSEQHGPREGGAESQEPQSPDDCRAAHPGAGHVACRWELMRLHCPGGAPREPDPRRLQSGPQTCVCHGCDEAADCAGLSGGRCESLRGARHCSPAARVCRFDGDPCDQGCDGGFCANDGSGRPRCAEPYALPM